MLRRSSVFLLLFALFLTALGPVAAQEAAPETTAAATDAGAAVDAAAPAEPPVAEEPPAVTEEPPAEPTAPPEPPTPTPAEPAAEPPPDPAEDPNAAPSEPQPTVESTPVPGEPTVSGAVEAQAVGDLAVETVDPAGQPLPGACFRLYIDVGGGARGNDVVSRCDSDDPASDGLTTVVGLPAGNYVVAELEWPAGYLPAADQTVTIAPGETRDLEFINVLGDKVVVHVVDENDQPVPGACFRAEGARLIEAGCDDADGANDGTTTVSGLETGDYVLLETTIPREHAGASGTAFSVVRGETTELTVVNLSLATLRVRTVDAAGTTRPGGCFRVSRDAGGGAPGATFADLCDGSDALDGITTFRLPAGDVVVEHSRPPDGYVTAPESVRVHLDPGQDLVITVVSPLASTVIVHTEDLFGGPIKDACYTVSHDAGGGQPGEAAASLCDYFDGAVDGDAAFTGLAAGAYVLVQNQAPQGYEPAAPLPFTIGTGETKELTVPHTGQPPKITTGPWIVAMTQTAATIYWETDQPSSSFVDYGLTTNLGRLRPLTPGPDSTTHRVEISPLNANTRYYFRVRSANGNGETVSDTYEIRTPAATANATLVVTKVNGDLVALPGACFEVYRNAGNGALGDFVRGACDRYDLSPNDGRTVLNGLAPGSYVLVETLAPAGYALAKNRTFSVVAGQHLALTVKDPRGGAQVTVMNRDPAGTPVQDACFDVFVDPGDGTIGPYVGFGCDDYDGLDGRTILGGLRVGKYYLWESYVPTGYVRAPLSKFSIVSGQRTLTINVKNYPEASSQNVVATTVDALGRPVPGACFTLFTNAGRAAIGTFVADACDGADGRYDGRTFFTEVAAGSYVLLEYHAPNGYLAGKKTAFTKSGGMRTLTIQQQPGTVGVRVTTRKGDTSQNLPGACYGLFKATGRHEPVAYWCDEDDGTRDGVTRFAGLPAGTYILSQTYTPPGYRRPGDRSVTVGTTTASVTIRTYPAP